MPITNGVVVVSGSPRKVLVVEARVEGCPHLGGPVLDAGEEVQPVLPVE